MQLIDKLMAGNPGGPRAAVEFHSMCAGSDADLPYADILFGGGLLYQDIRKIFLGD